MHPHQLLEVHNQYQEDSTRIKNGGCKRPFALSFHSPHWHQATWKASSSLLSVVAIVVEAATACTHSAHYLFCRNCSKILVVVRCLGVMHQKYNVLFFLNTYTSKCNFFLHFTEWCTFCNQITSVYNAKSIIDVVTQGWHIKLLLSRPLLEHHNRQG